MIDLEECERVANYTTEALHPTRGAIIELCAEVRRLREENVPAIEWTPNGEAGDSTGACEGCGEERDEPHAWRDCRKNWEHKWDTVFDVARKSEEEIDRLRTALATAKAEGAREERAAVVRYLREFERYCKEAKRDAEHEEARRTWSVQGSAVGSLAGVIERGDHDRSDGDE